MKQLILADLVRYFDYIETDLLQNGGQEFPQITRTFLKVTRDRQLPLHEWVRLVLPQEDIGRKYNTREETIIGRLVNIYGWKGTGMEVELKKWREKLHSSDITAGNLSLRLQLFRENQTPDSDPSQLCISQVNLILDQIAMYCQYSDISTLQLPSSPDEKKSLDELFRMLFAYCSPSESKWLVRIILKDLKLPFSREKFLYQLHPMMNTIYQYRHSILSACRLLDKILATDSVDCKSWITPEVGCNVGIIECEKGRSTLEVFRNFIGQSVAVETKYDGERIQVHIIIKDTDKRMVIFNKSKRNATLERQSAHQFILAGLGLANEDFLKRIGRQTVENDSRDPIRNIIIEGELLTINETDGKIEKFGGVRNLQEFTRDGFKAEDNIHFYIVWFDILHLNDRNLTYQPYHERRRILESTVECIPNFVSLSDRRIFDFSNSSINGTLKEFRQYYTELILKREEGAIVKPLTSSYEPCKKGVWWKLKKDYIPGLGDTADFVVIGGSLAHEIDSKFTRGENRLGGMVTSFVIACLENKEEIQRAPFARPRFRIVFEAQAGQNETNLTDFEQRTFDSRIPNCKFIQQLPSLNLPYDIILAKSGISWRTIDFFYPQPHIFELMGGGFTREYGDDFYILRFPRILKERNDVRWQDCISFQELQVMAKKAFDEPEDAEKEREYLLEMLEDVDERLSSGRNNIMKRSLDYDNVSIEIQKRKEIKLDNDKLPQPAPLTVPSTTECTLFPNTFFLFSDNIKNSGKYDEILDKLGFTISDRRIEKVQMTNRYAKTLTTLHALTMAIGWYDQYEETPLQHGHKGVVIAEQDELMDIIYSINELIKNDVDLKWTIGNLEVYDSRILMDWNEETKEQSLLWKSRTSKLTK